MYLLLLKYILLSIFTEPMSTMNLFGVVKNEINNTERMALFKIMDFSLFVSMLYMYSEHYEHNHTHTCLFSMVCSTHKPFTIIITNRKKIWRERVREKVGMSFLLYTTVYKYARTYHLKYSRTVFILLLVKYLRCVQS